MFTAGQVSDKINVWSNFDAPESIISILSGYRIPFVRKPPLKKFNKTLCNRLQAKQTLDMSEQIQKLLSIGAITKCNSESGFLSPLFLRQKTDGSNRPILNLKLLNLYLRPPRFRLINHHRIPSCLNKYDYMVKIDLSQAYFHIPVTPSHRRFLAFAYKNIIYEMTCLPFGLATAPSVFAKVTNWVANFFREKSIKVIIYLDDFLIIHNNPAILREQTKFVLKNLEAMGWCVNYKKSHLIPARQVEYLGIIWNTESNTKYLPESKITKNITILKQTLKKQRWTWWQAKVLLGNLNFSSFVVPLGRLHCRRIQIEAARLPQKERHKKFLLPEIVVQELHWWLQNIVKPSPIHREGARTFITIDAAKDGWGATVNQENLCGPWIKHQKSWHSNQKELWTLLEVLLRVGPKLTGQTVMIQTDNKSVVAYITKEGGTRSLKLLLSTYKILTLAHHYRIHLVARYLPGRYNLIADSLSREYQLPEWTLSRNILKIIFNRWGTPSVDLFASARSAIMKRYVSEDVKDRKCLYVDAFSQPWNFSLGWAFPPPAMIPRVLQHLMTSSGTYLLVAPKWERTFWKADLKQRALSPPFTIHNVQNHLIDMRTSRSPPGAKDLCLQVWRVRAGPI